MKRLALKDKEENRIEGVLLVDKPLGYTSHDLVTIIKRLTGIKKVGHLGTLDPMATGLLPLVLNRATILSRFMMKGEKKYIAWIRLGFSTKTYDIEGEKVSYPIGIATDRDRIINCLRTFEGRIQQQPPPYSAKKLEGQKLYSLARKGQMIKVEPKEVIIHKIKLLDFAEERLCLEIECSAGTYIRFLAHDLGQRLGCGAYLSSLIRVRSGGFYLEDALSLEEIEVLVRKNELDKKILAINQILNNLPSLTVSSSCLMALSLGGKGKEEYFSSSIPSSVKKGYYRLISQQGNLLAIAKAIEDIERGKIFLRPEIAFF